MPAILRNIETGLFFGKEEWTRFISYARRFKDAHDAEIEVRNRHLKRTEVLIVQGDSIVGGSPMDQSEA
jgi:hypothetical protein